MKQHSDYANALRQIADFVEAHTDIPAPSTSRIDIWTFGHEGREKQIAASFARSIGKIEKDTYGPGNVLVLRKQFGPVSLECNVPREQVCERVVVGRRVIPAQPQQIVPAKPEEVVDEVEWRCQPILGAGTTHTIEGEAPQLEAPKTLQLEAEIDIPF